MVELTTHVLDTSHGQPARGVQIRLCSAREDAKLLALAETDTSGRARLTPETPLLAGRYDLVFAVGAYFAATGTAEPEPRFLDDVVIRFGLRGDAVHYHVPLLISPFGYTTYRGQ